jgi:hypothetical protein
MSRTLSKGKESKYRYLKKLMLNKRSLRAVLLSLVAFSMIPLLILSISLGGLAAADTGTFDRFEAEEERVPGERAAFAPPRDGITIVTSHREGNIVALNPDGTVLYHNNTYDGYWDVDPSSEGSHTVVYAASAKVSDSSICHPVDNQNHCIKQMIVQDNLTSGKIEILYSRLDPRYSSSEWHDVDHVKGSLYAVADMYSEEVFIVDVNSGIVTWEWGLQSAFSTSTGNQYPRDWVHLNDVEVLTDGRLMLSARNLDQVLFVDPTEGLDETWTIGGDDELGTLFEQHNPDYIPEVMGGPAVLIADSENDRIVEYQRTQDGDWTESWIWQDQQMQWPRDADRLPNGNTLIGDSGGNRVIEVNQTGGIVWQLNYPGNYEVERLETGDESTGGESASQLNLTSTIDSPDSENPVFSLYYLIKQSLPSKVVNGLINGTPLWMGFPQIVAGVPLFLSLITWFTAEWRWSDFSFRFPVTLRK